ncbi:MAG TPA: ATP-binding cassette domain-containing protein, partial [Methanobacterium sp.]|nr:ATP-binding cassette domain-containing protein [Methanobacterium sp.]
MNFIEIQNVSKSFKDIPVLKNINVDIVEGSVLGILGRSGAGKSVLI